MYGDKSQTEIITITGVNGRKYTRTNLEYFIKRFEFDALRQEGKSLHEICKLIRFTSDERQLHRLLKKFNWDVGEKVYGKSRTISVNENFFKTWTRESAWVYGWLLTDGSITEKGWQTRIMLKRTDRDVLEKVKTVIQFGGEIYDGEQKDGRQFSYIRICDKEIVNDLFSLGMARANKTFNTVFPKCPDKVFWDLIRGIFEGDGSVRHRTGNTDALDITVAGATYEFITDLQNELANHGVFTRVNTRKAHSCSGNKHDMYTLNTKSNADALRLCYFMYANTNEDIRMNRKFAIYENYLNTYYNNVKRRSAQCNEMVELALQNIAI